MKTLKITAILILIILKTIPAIIETYKTIFKNIIQNKEEIIRKTKILDEAYKHIKTTHIEQTDKNDIPKDKKEIIEKLRKRQRNKVNYYYNKTFNKEVQK